MSDCIVVGGGLIGMLTARELAQSGLAVILIERSETGHESSWAGGGILSPLYPWRYPEAVNELAKLSQLQHQALAEELQQETGIDPEWVQSGLLMLNVVDQAAALSWAAGHQVDLQQLGKGTGRALEPALRENCSNAFWMPKIAQIRNPRLVKALKASLQIRGVEIREHTAAQSLLIRSNQITGVATSRGTIVTGTVVLACGAWSPELLEPLGQRLEITPVRGQMILFRGPPGLVRHIVMEGSYYLIPRRDGYILAGSTVEPVGFDKSTTQVAKDELREAAIAMVPALANHPIENHWAGLRPGSPAGIPFIGKHPAIRGLYVNAGHYRNGIVLGPASARLLADLMLGRIPLLDPGPYSLAARREEMPGH